jgi:hypothetical protein
MDRCKNYTNNALAYVLNKFIYRKLFKIFFFLVFFNVDTKALGVLTHEAIIDAAWEKSILPLLRSKYPSSTPEQFLEAHAYAYGGAVAPDMGYYPFGNPFFTDLIHYVRSGDIVKALLDEAQTLNELAFAVGFLAHYNADNHGHPEATNISVPLVYPKMQKKFGDTVTYAENKISHMRMEFGFDVLQTARGNYASKDYHDFIGFKVDTAVLARAFYKTYGLNVYEIFNNHLAFTVESFRFMVANVFPLITKTAWARKKSDIRKLDSTATITRIVYKNRIKDYNKEFGKGYQGPGFFSTTLSVFIRVIPKIGPFRALKFKVPVNEAETYFAASFDSIVNSLNRDVNTLKNSALEIDNFDYDTGNPTKHCEYELADGSYSEWLLKLRKNDFQTADANIKNDIRKYYAGFRTMPLKNKCKRCEKVFTAITELRNLK